MKKFFLSILSLSLGVSLSFAQTNQPSMMETEHAGQEVEMERMVAEGNVGRTELELEMLPKVVREAYLDGPYSKMELLGVYKLATEIGTEPVIYEFELLEIAESTSATAFGGLEIERVSNQLPDLIIQVNEDGEIVEKKLAEETEE